MQIGIDFGTFYSSAAIMTGNTIKLVKDPVQHGYSFPSSLFVTDQNEILVGHAAENQRFKDLSRYRREFKRELGHNVPIILGDKSFQVEDMISEVLKRLKTEAEFLTETPLEDAVITVPAMYAHYKKELMEKAGQSAGLNVTLLEEPIAAVSYYNWQSENSNPTPDEEIILAFDFGGGTFDAALVKKKSDHHELLAMPTGLEYCGGLDFDRKIYEDLKAKCSTELRNTLEGQDNKAMKLRFMTAQWCQEIKHQLSETQEAEILIPIGEMESYRLDRKEFNAMIEPMVMEAIDLSSSLVQKAGLTWEKVNQILLVGGSCRIPLIHDLLAAHTQRPVLQVDDPEFAVCQGAALHRMKVKKTQKKPSVSTPTQKIKKNKPIAPASLDFEALSDFILKTLKKINNAPDLYISPAIPPNKLNNASQTCHVPDTERILGLIDFTFFGSAKDAMVFCEKAIYFHSLVTETLDSEDGPKKQVSYIADNIRYDQFQECIFHEFDTQLYLGGKKLYPGDFEGEWILEILETIKKHIPEIDGSKFLKKNSQEKMSDKKQVPLSRDRILKILKKNKDHNLFISPAIPPRKVANASQSCSVPKNESILGIMDCTYFGSASNAMVFGEKGIYFHSDHVIFPVSDKKGGNEEYEIKIVTGNCTYENLVSKKFTLIDGQIDFPRSLRFGSETGDIEVIFNILKHISDEIKKNIKYQEIIVICQKHIAKSDQAPKKENSIWMDFMRMILKTAKMTFMRLRK